MAITNKNSLLIVALLTILSVRCVTADKISYHYPEHLTKEQRNELKEKCDKGKELFKIHCSECHGIFTKGKEKIPDFTETQIDNYSARFLRHDPKNHAVTKEMSPDQMNQVLNFLRYRELPKKTTKAEPEKRNKDLGHRRFPCIDHGVLCDMQYIFTFNRIKIIAL